MSEEIKIFIFYTKNIEYLVDLLIKSGTNVPNTEYVPVLHEKIYDDCNLGVTNGQGYLEMCLHNHLTKLKIIKENIGSNIMLLDADIVINDKLDFVKVINELLLTNDFLFQYDPNGSMSKNINLGITAVKCSENSIELWESHCEKIIKIPLNKRRGGYPQIEFNNLIGTEYWESKIKYNNLPKTFGYKGDDSYLYHAIAVKDKHQALQAMLERWDNIN